MRVVVSCCAGGRDEVAGAVRVSRIAAGCCVCFSLDGWRMENLLHNLTAVCSRPNRPIPLVTMMPYSSLALVQYLSEEH